MQGRRREHTSGHGYLHMHTIARVDLTYLHTLPPAERFMAAAWVKKPLFLCFAAFNFSWKNWCGAQAWAHVSQAHKHTTPVSGAVDLYLS